MSIKERLRGRLRNQRKQELRNRRKRLLRFEPLEGRMLLSAAGPVNPSQWSFGTWGSGLAFTGSDYVGMTGNGRNQGGDTVAIATPNVIIVDDFYADVYMRVNYVSDSNGDGITMEIGNGDTIRNIVRFIRDANGDLYTHSESASVMSQDTVTISNNASHRIEVNVGVDSASVFIDGQHIVTFTGALPDNASVTFGLRGDKDYVEAKITETNGIFSDFTSNLVVASEPVVEEVLKEAPQIFMMVAIASPEVAVAPIVYAPETVNVSQWTTNTWYSGDVTFGDGYFNLSANGEGILARDNVVEAILNTFVTHDFALTAFLQVNYPSDHNGDGITMEIGNHDTVRDIIRFIRNPGEDTLRLHVEGTSEVLQQDDVVIANNESHRIEVVNGVDSYSIFIDGQHFVTRAGRFIDNASLKIGVRGDKDLVKATITETYGLFTNFVSELGVTPQEATLNISMFAMPEVQSVPVVEAASFVASVALLVPVVPPMGSVQSQSFAERIARGIGSSDSIKRTGATYYDEGRGVDVYAGSGQYFVEYTNGAVELRVLPNDLPAGQPHPWVHEITPILRNTPELGQVSKPVKRTGGTFYDTVRGIDVYAKDGYYLIQYEDGSVEERIRPDGDFIPRPEDFTIGGADNSQPMSTFGPSITVLGISTEGTPTSSSELWYLGTSYVSTLTGELRIAPSGQEFFQHPDSKVILLRPQEDKAVALEKPTSTTMATIVVHSAQKINDNFLNAFGRLPTDNERKIWQKRTDKDGAALLGAMQYAYQQEQAGVDQVMAEVGNLENKVLGYSSDFDPILFPEIPQYDELPQLPRVEFDIPFDLEALELVEPIGLIDIIQAQIESEVDWWQRISEIPTAPLTEAELEEFALLSGVNVRYDQIDAFTQFYHPANSDGTTAENSVRLWYVWALGGEQATYDQFGNLITEGTAAGSSDWCSPYAMPPIGFVCHVGLEAAPATLANILLWLTF